MLRHTLFAFVSAAALATAAFAEEPGQPMGGMTGGASSEMRDAMSSNPDVAFGAVLVSHARLQRQISELVAQKANNPQIKQLAQDTAQQYQKWSDQFKQVAQKEGITIHEDRMLPRDQAILNHLQQLPADRLERDYVFYQAGANQTLMFLSQWAANHAQKPEVKRMSQEVAQRLQQRSQTIDKLAGEEVGGSK